MIDESQRFFDVALAITRFGIVLPDESAQRGAHLLVGSTSGGCPARRKASPSSEFAETRGYMPSG